MFHILKTKKGEMLIMVNRVTVNVRDCATCQHKDDPRNSKNCLPCLFPKWKLNAECINCETCANNHPDDKNCDECNEKLPNYLPITAGSNTIKTERTYDDLDQISKEEWDEYYDKVDRIKNLVFDGIKLLEPTATYKDQTTTEFEISIQDISFNVMIEM